MSEGNILVNYKGANQETISAGPRDQVRLNPGVNTVDKAKWNRIIESAKEEKKNSKIKTPKGGILYLIDNDLVVVVPAAGADGDDTDTDANGLVDVTKMKPKDAIDVVNAELNIDNLNVFLTAEKGNKNRVTLVKAIETQIDALTKAANEEAEKAAENKED